MIFDKCRTPMDQGNIGQARAIYELQKLGYVVSIPITQNQKYDLVAELNGTLSRVQVKTCDKRRSHNKFEIKLSTSGHLSSGHKQITRKRGDYELLFILTGDNECYLIPDSEIANRKSGLTLTESFNKHKL